MTTRRDAEHTAFPEQVPRPDKRVSGRTDAGATPVNIRSDGVTIDEALHEHVRTRLGGKLAKHALRIERVTVRFKDVNGPKGGVDTNCQIKVVLAGLPSVVVEQRAASPHEAFDLCADVAPRAVQHAIGRSDSGG